MSLTRSASAAAAIVTEPSAASVSLSQRSRSSDASVPWTMLLMRASLDRACSLV